VQLSLPTTSNLLCSNFSSTCYETSCISPFWSQPFSASTNTRKGDYTKASITHYFLSRVSPKALCGPDCGFLHTSVATARFRTTVSSMTQLASFFILGYLLPTSHGSPPTDAIICTPTILRTIYIRFLVLEMSMTERSGSTLEHWWSLVMMLRWCSFFVLYYRKPSNGLGISYQTSRLRPVP
jgi:hypothetical protein